MISLIHPVLWAAIAVTHQFTLHTNNLWNLCGETPHNTETIWGPISVTQNEYLLEKNKFSCDYTGHENYCGNIGIGVFWFTKKQDYIFLKVDTLIIFHFPHINTTTGMQNTYKLLKILLVLPWKRVHK